MMLATPFGFYKRIARNAFKLLVITRNYPPQTGGLENYSFNLIRELRRNLPVHMIALKRPKIHLCWFLPAALIYSLYLIRFRSITNVHFCDGLLAPIGAILRAITGVRVTATVHGFDISYPNRIYQKTIPGCLERLDKIVCVSRSTRNECIKRQISPKRCVVIPNGVHLEEVCLKADKAKLMARIQALVQRPLENKKILITVGRLIKRKGISWFVANVMPLLESNYIYLIVGTGPEFSKIEKLIMQQQLRDRVVLAGKQPDHVRNYLLNVADAFIMPNISIPGDVEGFGIAALEAGACGLPVIASGIQGIRDSVIDGVTGHLVAEGDANGFVSRILSLNLKQERVRSEVAERFSWEKIGMLYTEMLGWDEKDGFRSL